MSETHGTREQAIYLKVRAMLREKWETPSRPDLRLVRVDGREVSKREDETVEAQP